MGRPAGPCQRCGLPKAPGRGAKVCERCRAEVQRERRERHRIPEVQERQRNNKLKATYGITAAQYEIIWHSQGEACAICRRKRRETEKRFPVEHDHKTKAIRGITCTYCNRTRLGRGREDPVIVHRIEDYLLHGAERVALTLKTASDWGQS